MTDINFGNISRLEEFISRARRIAIVTHRKPDGDAMGSCIALYHCIGMYGSASAKIIINDRYPDYLGFLAAEVPDSDMIVHAQLPLEAETAIKDSDLVICLDFNAFHRADRLEAALTESKADKILIDHHLNPAREAFDLVFSETDISSASELLYHILMETVKIGHDASMLPPAAARALMTGMTTDTNNFANSTYPSTFRMASALLATGVDRDEILSRLYNQYGENRLRVLGHMMKDLLTITEDGVAYMVLDKATLRHYNVGEGDTEGFVNMPLSIAEVRMSFLIKEDDDRVRVSIRSKKGTSANTCARLYFNGGGHENAAGGKLNMPADITDITEAAGYIERTTHEFFTRNNEHKE